MSIIFDVLSDVHSVMDESIYEAMFIIFFV